MNEKVIIEREILLIKKVKINMEKECEWLKDIEK